MLICFAVLRNVAVSGAAFWTAIIIHAEDQDIIIIIIIIILGISFMQGIYAYIPETNHVPREHCVATSLV